MRLSLVVKLFNAEALDCMLTARKRSATCGCNQVVGIEIQ